MDDAQEIGLRYYFSGVHLRTARIFGCECRAIECAYGPGDWQEIVSRYQAFAIGAVFAAVAGLEAGINEVFVDAVAWQEENRTEATRSRPDGVLNGLDTCVVRRLAESWTKFERRDVMSKCNKALADAGLPKMAPAEIEETKLVIKLRNELVHYKPKTEWLETGTGSRETNRVLVELENKFAPSPFFEDTADPFFPRKCLGYGSASWALDSIESFLREFHRRMGTTPSYLT